MRVNAWNAVEPDYRLPVAERWFLNKRHDAHIGAIKGMRASVDNRAPPKAMGANMVKIALRQEEIDRTNQLLRAKLSNLHVPTARKSQHEHVSISTVASAPVPRKSVKEKLVARENSLMRKRIQNTRSALKVDEHRKDFARHEKYSRQISRVSLIATSSAFPSPSLASPKSPPSLVPLRGEAAGGGHTASSGWSDELWGNSS
jgi:hypothetical protein